MDLNLFPNDINKSLKKTLLNPAATANGETALLLVLRQYNTVNKTGSAVLATLPDGTLFTAEKQGVFKKIKLRRKRIECLEVKTGNIYLFSALTEVKVV